MMSFDSKRRDQRENTFIGEVDKPFTSSDNSMSIGFRVHPVQDGIINSGVAQLITNSSIIYPVVIRSLLTQNISTATRHNEYKRDQLITVDGITLTQAQQMHRLIQKREPKKRAFVGEVSDPFVSPTISQGYVGFQLRPIQQPRLLYPNGVLRLNEVVQLLSLSGEVYTASIRGSERPRFDLSGRANIWHRAIIVDAITLGLAQNIYRITQDLGPDATTALFTILEAMPSFNTSNSIDFRVRVLQCGLMRKSGGTTQLMSTSGDAYPITIRSITAVPTSHNSLLENGGREYIMNVDKIPLAQAKEMQTLIQEPEELKDL